jgi:hypothetical protein
VNGQGLFLKIDDIRKFQINPLQALPLLDFSMPTR